MQTRCQLWTSINEKNSDCALVTINAALNQIDARLGTIPPAIQRA